MPLRSDLRCIAGRRFVASIVGWLWWRIFPVSVAVAVYNNVAWRRYDYYDYPRLRTHGTWLSHGCR